MKIVVRGEITAEKLAVVLNTVALEHDSKDFAGFYEATIQIRSFDKEGLEFTDIYQYEPGGQRVFDPRRGDPVLPALSQKGYQWAREKFGSDEERMSQYLAANIARMRAARETAKSKKQVDIQS